MFTPVIKALQERYGSRRQYARLEESGVSRDRLGPQESEFIVERDSFYMASIGETGWPYVQHRGGPKGFLKVIDGSTIAFADFRGNKQYISTGNLMKDNRVALIMVDYPGQARLKILGHAEIFSPFSSGAKKPRYFTCHEKSPNPSGTFDWNCPQHITPRFTAEEIQEALAPFERRVEDLEQENKRLREALAQRKDRDEHP